jgi:hypothetical protein
MLGLEGLKKGYFPHLFNRKENQSVVLNHLPDVYYYTPDAMKLKDRKAFFMWYETNYRQRFDFQRELLSYCRSDVDILRRACLTFRQLFLEMTCRFLELLCRTRIPTFQRRHTLDLPGIVSSLWFVGIDHPWSYH